MTWKELSDRISRMTESVCPANEFFSFVKDKDEITEQEFKSICI